MPIPLSILLSLPILLAAVAIPATSQVPNTGCRRRCGNISVPYPFGIDEGCFRSGFHLTCNETTKPATLSTGDFQILDIDHLNGRLRVNVPIARDCFDSNGVPLNTGTASNNLIGTPFSFSAKRNRFTVTGCDTLVYMNDPKNFGFATGCVSTCRNMTGIPNNTCSGIGCCQTSIPVGLKYFQAEFRSFNNHTKVWYFNPCSYAFVVEDGAFEFHKEFLMVDYTFKKVKLPVIFDWYVGAGSCEKARMNIGSYACRSLNSDCISSNDGLGYLCNCSRGYEGNPYEENGCRDIVECGNPKLYPCQGVCENTPGSYKCSCPLGTHSDDPKTKSCTSDVTTSKDLIPFYLKLVIGVGGGVIFVLVLSFIIYFLMQKRKLLRMKQKMFQQNGGLFLQQQISSHQATSFKIFTTKEMERATNNYSDDRILGKGGHGMVYKGILDDNRVVAIKKSMVMEESMTKEFAREMIILSQINHINIVKLLGCCLEVEVPIMVYEYVPNGTLFHYIHVRRLQIVIPLSIRLRIAAESAEALAYLHSAASPPILHGDVKSSNILLDDNYIVKVSDFGTSILAPNDKAQFTTLVQGTCGYLDPEYMQTCELTEKSDVYSFGVVLLELLTGKKALSFGGTSEGDRSLVQCFITCKKQNKLLEILDSQLVDEGLTKQLLDVCELALQCLNLRGDERPTSKELLVELGAIRRSGKHPSVEHHTQEMNAQIPSSSSGCFGEDSNNINSDTTSYVTTETALLGNINSGR